MKKEVIVETTKKGYPAMWESGGGYTNTGEAIIIAGPEGEPKTPIYIRKRGDLANGQHALFIVSKGDIVVEANHHRKDFEISIYRISSFTDDDDGFKYAYLEKIHHFSRGEWDIDPPEDFEDAIEASMGKATCYHCRESHYYHLEEETF